MLYKILPKVFTILPFVDLIFITVSSVLRNMNIPIPEWLNVILIILSILLAIELICVITVFVIARILRVDTEEDNTQEIENVQ